MRRFCGIDLHEYLTGARPASEGLRRIGYFPPESATVAALRANPVEREGDPPPEPWRGLYGQGPVYDVLADLWDLQASKGTAKGKKTPQHPRGAPQRPRRRRRRPTAPTP